MSRPMQPPASPDSYFTDDAVIRRVLREVATALSGPRALLMMAAHPVAFEGFFMSTGALDDPYKRLQRTGVVMNEIVWGSRAKADAYTARVRKAHAGVRGVLPRDAGPFPAGTPYAADDPDLLLWVLSCLVDSADLSYRNYVGPLSRDERDELWQGYRVVGGCFGLAPDDMPADIEGFDRYMAEMVEGDMLWVTPKARELGRQIVLSPPVGLKYRPVLEAINFLTIGWLPPRVRRGFGLRWDPVRGAALQANAEYVKRFVLPLLPESLRVLPVARAAGATVPSAVAAASEQQAA
jgi:uncharacterized protein (DUF2236 family)